MTKLSWENRISGELSQEVGEWLEAEVAAQRSEDQRLFIDPRAGPLWAAPAHAISLEGDDLAVAMNGGPLGLDAVPLVAIELEPVHGGPLAEHQLELELDVERRALTTASNVFEPTTPGNGRRQP